MMTHTHSLMAAALLADPERPRRHNAAILLGSFIPDAAIFSLFVWSKFANIPEQILWQETYFSEPMLTLTAIGNSLPLYSLILIMAVLVVLSKTVQQPIAVAPRPSESGPCSWRLGITSALVLFALAAIIHLLGDFPVHAADAHPHFWPFTDWRFHSPISYWDHNHHGHVFSIVEATVGIALSVIVFRRFNVAYVRVLAVLTMCAYVAVPFYFSLML